MAAPSARMRADLASPRHPLEVRSLAAHGSDEPAIALLDAWALVADVVAFYSERIATEGFLRTATQTGSVRELARTLGYELRPGVAAEADLVFTAETAPGAPATVTVAAGTPVQSVPGAGQAAADLPDRGRPGGPRRVEQPAARARVHRQTVIPRGPVVWLQGTQLRIKPGGPAPDRGHPGRIRVIRQPTGHGPVARPLDGLPVVAAGDAGRGARSRPDRPDSRTTPWDRTTPGVRCRAPGLEVARVRPSGPGCSAGTRPTPTCWWSTASRRRASQTDGGDVPTARRRGRATSTVRVARLRRRSPVEVDGDHPAVLPGRGCCWLSGTVTQALQVDPAEPAARKWTLSARPRRSTAGETSDATPCPGPASPGGGRVLRQQLRCPPRRCPIRTASPGGGCG